MCVTKRALGLRALLALYLRLGLHSAIVVQQEYVRSKYNNYYYLQSQLMDEDPT